MKKFTFFVILLLFVSTQLIISQVNSPLTPLAAGTYPINGTENPPTSFQNLTTAISYITTNGVSGTGQVIFELATGYAGTEPGPVNLGTITGLSETLGITFRPATGFTAVTEVVGGASPNQHAFAINGASYITLDGRAGGSGTSRDWTIRVTGTTNAQMAVRLNNTAGAIKNIVVRNLIMEAAAASVTGATFQITGTAAIEMSNVLVENNLIKSIGTVSPSVRGYGITVAVVSNALSTGLIIRNNDVVNFYARGINFTGGFPGAEVYGNNFYHDAPITMPSTTEFSGIYFSTTAAQGAKFYNNKVYNIQLTNGSTAINGIYMFNGNSAGDPIQVYNNIVSFGDGLTGTAAPLQVYGIRENALSGSLINFYYNSVYLSGNVPSGTNLSAAFRKQTSNFTNVSNNIFYNARSNDGGTGTHWAVMYNNATYSSLSNNAYFVNGAGGVLGTSTGTTVGNQATLADWQTAIGGDQGSLFINPNFVAPTATPPNLKINDAIATPLESGGIIIADITTDFEGDARYPNAGYPNNPNSPASASDIGADEFAGIGVDVSPPLINYDPLPNTALFTDRFLNVTISDPSGVTVGANGSRLYYKKGINGTYHFDNSPATSGDELIFKFDAAVMGGVQTGDTVYYYMAAQDSAGNVGTNPSGGSGVNPPGTTAPNNPNFYAILPSLSGTFTVGTGANYENLTAVANLLNGNSVVTGNVIFELTNNYDGTTGETLPIVFNQFVASDTTFTVTIRPATGVTNRVTSGDPGSNFAFPVINIVGGDNFIFDGRPGGIGTSNEWTIRNTRAVATIGCVVRFADDATNNTLRNLNLESQATLTTTGVIFFHTSASGSVGNSYNNILNNNIRPRTDEVAPSISNGILSNGTAAAPNTGNVISGNNIINFNNIGISLVATGNGPDWIISDNHFYNPTHSSTSAQTGISVASANSLNMEITGNFIGGSAPGATGTLTNSGAGVIVTGIILSNGVSNVSNNTIANITQTGTGTGARLRGIYVSSANDGNNINGNQIFNLITSSTGVGLGAGVQPVAGISVWTGSTFYVTNVTGNTIYNLVAENTFANATSNLPCGMFLTNVGLGSIVDGNKIYDIKNKATGVTEGQPPIAAGIYIRFIDSALISNNMITLGLGENTNTQFNGILVVAGQVGNDNYYMFNSIAIEGTSGGANSSFGVLRGDNTAVSPGSSIFMYNNILYNNRSGGGSSNYAVGFQGADTTLNLFSNYNVYFTVDSNTVGLFNTTNKTLSDWKNSSNQDGNTISKGVFFLNPVAGDLHLTGSSNGDFALAGIPIAGITTDFDGDTRDLNAPYRGADEASIPIPVELTSFVANVNERDVIINWVTATESNSSSFIIERKTEENWINIGSLQASGNSTEPREYSFTDKKLGSGNYSYRLKMVDLDGTFEYSNVVEVEIGVPITYSVSQNYPNPFNPTTRIDYQLPVNAKVQIELYSVTGEKVATLVNNELEAGYYTVDLDAKSLRLASGVYLYRLISTDYNGKQFMDIKKMMLLK